MIKNLFILVAASAFILSSLFLYSRHSEKIASHNQFGVRPETLGRSTENLVSPTLTLLPQPKLQANKYIPLTITADFGYWDESRTEPLKATLLVEFKNASAAETTLEWVTLTNSAPLTNITPADVSGATITHTGWSRQISIYREIEASPSVRDSSAVYQNPKLEITGLSVRCKKDRDRIEVTFKVLERNLEIKKAYFCDR